MSRKSNLSVATEHASPRGVEFGHLGRDPDAKFGDAADRVLPARVDRKVAAEIVTRFYFPISKRTLEAWPLTWRHLNGKAICETDELLAEAQSKLDAAVPYRGGRSK
jgi:hypothetical protein